MKDYAEFWNWTECTLYYEGQGVESGGLNEIINHKSQASEYSMSLGAGSEVSKD